MLLFIQKWDKTWLSWLLKHYILRQIGLEDPQTVDKETKYLSLKQNGSPRHKKG